MITKPQLPRSKLNTALRAVASTFNVPEPDLTNGRRFERIIPARLTLYDLLSGFQDRSVAGWLGCHRTTLVHGRRALRTWTSVDPAMATRVDTARAKFEPEVKG